MNKGLYQRLLRIAKKHSHPDDPSHDFSHIQRVLKNVELLATKEGGDLDILVPAALFHDVINHPKNSPRAARSPDESADWTTKLLATLPDYPKEKISAVHDAILKCSFVKNIRPDLWESKLLQDADLLDSTGAVAIARTYSSAGTMKRPFYSSDDPFCEDREPNLKRYTTDLFFSRLLKVQERFHTQTARTMGKKRHKFLLAFIEQLKAEIE